MCLCLQIASLLGVSKDALEQVWNLTTCISLTVPVPLPLLTRTVLLFDDTTASQALCFKESTFGIGETITIPLDPPKAADQRDAFSKFIYGKLFDYIVFRVNNILFRGRLARSIGVLDIFGFEVFKLNSFEQLCINYCNERLQSFFNDVIFANERKVYEEEGIDASSITFQDNVGCVRLIDQRNTGIFALLDEEVVVPRGSDVKFVSRLHTTFDETVATKSTYFVRNRRKPNDFGVRHFAGDVMYTVDGFLEKNKDTLSSILVTMLKNSSVPVISAMASIGEDDGGGGAIMPPRKSEAALSRKSGKSEKLTLANKFKTDLDSLMISLDSTVPHFIRCVKPNDVQQPNK
jgi:myosin heavy subunit